LEDADDDNELLLRANNPLPFSPLPFGFFLVPGNLLLNQLANRPLDGLAGPATAPGLDDELDFFFLENIDKGPLLRLTITGAAGAAAAAAAGAAAAAAAGPPLGGGIGALAAAAGPPFGGGIGAGAAAAGPPFGGGIGAGADDADDDDNDDNDDDDLDEPRGVTMTGAILAPFFALVSHPGLDPELDADDDDGNEATHPGLSPAAAAAAAAAGPPLGGGIGAAAAAAGDFPLFSGIAFTVFDGSMPAFNRRFFDSCSSLFFFHSLYFFFVLSPRYLAPSTPFFPRYMVPVAPLFTRCAVAFLVLGKIYFAAFFSPHHTGNALLRSSLSFFFCCSSFNTALDSLDINPFFFKVFLYPCLFP
jgi:hypothetical protein